MPTPPGWEVTIGATAPAQVMVEAWPADNPADRHMSGWLGTNASNAATLVLPGAPDAGRVWQWRGQVRPASGSGAAVAGATCTLPVIPARGIPVGFTFAFGACALQKQIARTLQVAAAARPQLFAFIGDMGYMDNPTRYPGVQNYAGYSNLFRGFLRRADLAAILACAPLYGMQDDHDYGLDDCWGATVKPYAAQAFADVIPGGAYPAPSYRRWSVGDVDFFLTDNRRYQDAPRPPFENGRYRSMLGSVQRSWLLQGLAQSTARVKFVFLPMTMAWYWSNGERDEVLAHVADHCSGAVVFLSADKHAGGFARYSSTCYEMLACPLNNPTKHYTPRRPYVIWTENGTGRGLYNVVGMVDVDTATARRITLRLVRDDGVELHREVVPVP